jgi:FKBP-type peptidyl-prolyl cis-trans isomerase
VPFLYLFTKIRMKLKHTLTFSLLAVGLVAARAQEIKPNSPAPAAPAAPAFTEAQMLEEFGWFIGKRVGLSELEFGKTDMDAFLKGLSNAAANKESPYELEKIGPAMDEFLQKKQEVYTDKLKKKGAAETAALFAKLKENKNVVELPSGLRYEIVKPGSGAFPKATDTIKVHYTGALVDGTVFDSSVQRNEPMEIALNEVIPGWTEGIQKVNKGGKIKLYVPAALAYGERGQGSIPPGSTLVFDVELLDILPPAPTPSAPALTIPSLPGMPGAPTPAGK